MQTPTLRPLLYSSSPAQVPSDSGPRVFSALEAGDQAPLLRCPWDQPVAPKEVPGPWTGIVARPQCGSHEWASASAPDCRVPHTSPLARRPAGLSLA